MTYVKIVYFWLVALLFKCPLFPWGVRDRIEMYYIKAAIDEIERYTIEDEDYPHVLVDAEDRRTEECQGTIIPCYYCGDDIRVDGEPSDDITAMDTDHCDACTATAQRNLCG